MDTFSLHSAMLCSMPREDRAVPDLLGHYCPAWRAETSQAGAEQCRKYIMEEVQVAVGAHGRVADPAPGHWASETLPGDQKLPRTRTVSLGEG